MPKLRFPEFEGEWEIKSMKDIFTEIIEKNHPELPVLSILQGSGTVLRDSSDRRIIYDKTNLSSYKAMEIGDFIIHLRSFEGGLECSNHHGISSPAYKILRTKCLISEAYMDYFRSYMFVHGKLSIAVTGIRDGKSIDMPSFWGIKISFPTINEQRKIAAFLMLLKKRIKKQQQLVELLKSYKRGALSRLFPKNGASVPEYRFSGFTGDWEQRKVGDVLNESSDTGHSGDIAQKLTVKLWGKGVYAKNDKGSAATQYFTRHAGQFIYSKLDFLNSAFGVVPKELENYESTADLPAFDCVGVNPYFMFYRAIQPSFYLTNGMIADGSRKAKRIHVETFLGMPLDLPIIEEQNKIVNFFTHLDHLITLHQRKLDEYKSIKQGLLEKLFI